MSFEHLFNKNLERQAAAEERIAKALERLVEMAEEETRKDEAQENVA